MKQRICASATPRNTSAARPPPWSCTSTPCSRSSEPGAVAFDYGNNIRRFAFDAGAVDAFLIPGFVPEYIRPLFCTGQGPFRWIALSGDPKDIDRTDELALELFPENEILD